MVLYEINSLTVQWPFNEGDHYILKLFKDWSDLKIYMSSGKRRSVIRVKISYTCDKMGQDFCNIQYLAENLTRGGRWRSMLLGGGGPAELEPAVVLDGVELHRVKVDDAAVILTDMRSEIVFSATRMRN